MSMDSWFVYMVRCSDNSLYTGITTDVSRRVLEHNESGKGAKYTRARRPVCLVFFEECKTQSEALKSECQIKSLSKVKKELLIVGSTKN